LLFILKKDGKNHEKMLENMAQGGGFRLCGEQNQEH